MPHDFKTYGKERMPAPTAVYIRANILPLIDPGVNLPNHLDQHPLFFNSAQDSFDILITSYSLISPLLYVFARIT